jgi:hypothetical protein
MKPRIFVSSTFYDLKYVREDLSNFIKAHDFEPILFEDGDIGYVPGKPLDQSCYKTMHSTDMVLLIIGGNYGSPATGEKKEEFTEYMSVTRNEFKEAVDTGIPVYVFIDDKVYAEYGIYEQNIKKIENEEWEIIFKNVKNINVFRFIKEIQNVGNICITEFNKTIQIKEFLSKQWSDMFKNYLDILKEERADRKLEETVDDMKALIKRMDTMLNGIGKRVLGDDEQIKYDDVVKQIEIQTICDSLAISLTVGEFVKDNKEQNVEKYLEAVKDFLNRIDGMELNEREHDNLNKIYVEEVLGKRGAGYCTFSLEFAKNIELVKKINNKDVYEAVKNCLLNDKYYNAIFA